MADEAADASRVWLEGDVAESELVVWRLLALVLGEDDVARVELAVGSLVEVLEVLVVEVKAPVFIVVVVVSSLSQIVVLQRYAPT